METKYGTCIDETVEYYNNNAAVYIEDTLHADVSQLYEIFESLIAPGSRILDIGCGSGRDSQHFIRNGFNVVAIDPSSVMCSYAKSFAGVPVLEMKAEDIHFSEEFDAVWACASLLHVPRQKQRDTLKKICNALKPGGVFYCSWKYGEADHTEKGRRFTDLTEVSLRSILTEIPLLREEKIWISSDVRKDRHEQRWLNVILMKEKFPKK